jgi:hypothetical protein
MWLNMAVFGTGRTPFVTEISRNNPVKCIGLVTARSSFSAPEILV